VSERTFKPRRALIGAPPVARARRGGRMSASYALTIVQDAMSVTLKYVKSVH
jgi:hypothetical protein